MTLAHFFSQNFFVYMSHSTFFFGGQGQWIFYFYLFIIIIIIFGGGGAEFHTMATQKILCQRGLLGKNKFQNLPYFEGKKKKKKLRSRHI